MKHLIILVLVVVTFNSSCEAYTLDEVLVHTYQNNPQLKSVREQVKSVDESVMQAVASFLPAASFSKSFTSTQNGEGDVNSLRVKQNLFRGGRDVSAIKQAKYSIKNSHAKLIGYEQSVLLNTVQVYMKTLQTFGEYQISKQREAETRKYLDGMKTRFAAGQNTKTDVAQAEASSKKASAQRVKSYSDYESAKAEFIKVTGLQPKELSLPRDNIKLPKTLDIAKSKSIINNHTIISAKADYMAAQEGIAGNAGALLPTVDLSFLNQDVFSKFNNPTLQSSSQITLDINVPLFSGGADWSRVRQSTRDAKSKKYSLEDVRNAVVQSTTNAWESLIASKSILEAKKQEVKANKVAYEGFLAEEKVGLRDTIDVITVRTRYFDASIEVLALRTDYYTRIYHLKSQLGECVPTGLGLKVKTYDPLENYKGIRWQWVSAFTGE